MTTTFKTTTIPTVNKAGRTAMPNPFTEAFPSDEKALVVVVPEGHGSTEANRLVRQARQAAQRVDRTARVVEGEANGKATLTFWTVERITRKTSEAPAEA
jgi:hypothetical protein